MFKKFLNIVLTSAFIAGLSTAAYADNHMGFKVGASAKTYFGQYTAGTDDYVAHFANASEYNIKLKGHKGSLAWYGEAEFRSQGFTNSINTLTWSSDALSVGIGTHKNVAGLGYYLAGGAKTTAVIGVGAAGGTAAYAEEDGLKVNFKLNKLNLGVILYQADVLKGGAADGKGSATALYAMGKVTDSLGIRVTSVSSENDDWASTTDAIKSSATGVGVKFATDGLSVSFSNLSKSIKTTATGDAAVTTETGVQLGIAAGPGTAVVTIENTLADKGTSADTDDVKEAVTNVAYDIPFEKGSGMQLAYFATGNTVGAGDTYTESFIGAGFYAGF